MVPIHMLPYMRANTTTVTESKTVGQKIFEETGKVLLKTLVETIEVVKVGTVGNTLNNKEAKTMLKMPA